MKRQIAEFYSKAKLVAFIIIDHTKNVTYKPVDIGWLCNVDELNGVSYYRDYPLYFNKIGVKGFQYCIGMVTNRNIITKRRFKIKNYDFFSHIPNSNAEKIFRNTFRKMYYNSKLTNLKINL